MKIFTTNDPVRRKRVITIEVAEADLSPGTPELLFLTTVQKAWVELSREKEQS